MPLVVDATVGGTSSNSYQTVDEITDYFLARLPTSVADLWNDLDPTEQAAAAVMGTTWIEALAHWSRFATTSTQALSWPQAGQVDRKGWALIPDNVIPQELKNCHAEVALYLSQEDRLADFDPIKLGIRKLKAGPIDIEFHEKIPTEGQPPIIPRTIWTLLVPSWIDYIEDEEIGTRDLVRY